MRVQEYGHVVDSVAKHGRRPVFADLQPVAHDARSFASSADNAIVKANPTARPGGYQDTPLMVNGVLYTTTSLGVYAAIEPGTGRTLWQYDPEIWKAGRPQREEEHARQMEIAQERYRGRAGEMLTDRELDEMAIPESLRVAPGLGSSEALMS